MKRAGKRFEIACYKNKILNWRNGVEKDIDEVLQIDRIFKDVVRGIYASKKDLMKAFGTDDTNEISRIILDKGKEQVSGKERELQLKNVYLDIATIVSQKCINPETNRHYPVKVIERAMRHHHFNVHSTWSAKKQALRCIAFLKEKIPLERAKMRVRIALESSVEKDVMEKFTECLASIGALSIEKEKDEEDAMYFAFDPSKYREVQKMTKEHLDVDIQILHSNDSTNTKGTNVTSEEDVPKLPTPPKLTSSVSDMIPPPSSKSSKSTATNSSTSSAAKKTKSCRTCGGSFVDIASFRAHYKTDWHRYNQKAKQKKMEILSAEKFNAISKSELECFFAA